MNNWAIESINTIAARWSEVAWAVSWQFCILGLVVLLVHWTLHRAAPSWRYWLWQMLAIKLLLMPFWTATAPWKSPSSNSTADLITAVPRQVETASAKSETSPDLDSAPSRPAAQLKTERKGVSSGKSNHTVPAAPVTGPRVSAPERGTEGQAQQAESQVASPPIDRRQLIAASLPDASLQDRNIEKILGHTASTSALPLEPPAARSETATVLSWQFWLMLMWVGGVVWYGGRIVWQGVALSRRLRQTELAEPAVIECVRNAAKRLGMTQIPEVRVMDLDVSPFVCGLWRARLILPRGLAETFTAEQLDLVLLHELAHIRRHDLVWGWIPEVGKVFFFFHPLVHFLCYQIRFERELACDQLAMIAAGRDAATYADTLVRVVGQFSSPDSFRMAAAESPPV